MGKAPNHPIQKHIMKAILKVLSVLTLLAIAVPHLAYGDDKPAKSEKKGDSNLKSLHAQVDSITAELLTVKGDGPDTKFVINAQTKITKSRKDKTASTVADVKPGQWIGGSYSKEADGSNVLHSLHTAISQEGTSSKKSKDAK
jgi:hypothetical protein